MLMDIPPSVRKVRGEDGWVHYGLEGHRHGGHRRGLQGIDSASVALIRLFSSKNVGKQLLQLQRHELMQKIHSSDETSMFDAT